MNDEIAIKVEHVGKSFKLPHDKTSSIKGNLISRARKKNSYEVQHALVDINFEVRKGEFYGIVGKNGGGKSTLLKIISGIYTPSKGHVQINGKLTPFIELGVGFNPELTGRENVFLNGALLGFNRTEMLTMYHDIVKFAELEKFMDQKLKNYSSGMQVRLAFSIAIRAKSDILVMDEVLAVGDAAFQKKCFEVFRKLKSEGRTIILVTHDMGNVEKFCDRVLVIDKGEQVGVTSPSDAASIYARLNIAELKQETKTVEPQKRYGTGEITLRSATLLNNGEKTSTFAMGDTLELQLKLDRKPVAKKLPVACGLAIFNEDNVNIIGPNSEMSSIDTFANEIVFELPNIRLTPGQYHITIALYNQDMFTDYLELLDKWVPFSIVADHTTHGIVELEAKWTTN